MQRDKINKRGIELEEIFLDAKNIPGFGRENLEGRVENPIKNKIFIHIMKSIKKWIINTFI